MVVICAYEISSNCWTEHVKAWRDRKFNIKIMGGTVKNKTTTRKKAKQCLNFNKDLSKRIFI